MSLRWKHLKQKMRRTIPLYFSHVSLLGLKDFLLQIWESQSSVTSVCVSARACLCAKSILCMCANVREKGSESVIMRIIPQSWERAVPGYHTQPLSYTSTGHTGGPGSGDYGSDEAGTRTWSKAGKKTETLQMWGWVWGPAPDSVIERSRRERKSRRKKTPREK